LETAPRSWALRHHFRYGGMVTDAMIAMMARVTASSNAVNPDSLRCILKLLPKAEQKQFKTCAMLISSGYKMAKTNGDYLYNILKFLLK
jgi:hypothetical protein